MTFSLPVIALICAMYLIVLFVIAYSTEKGMISDRLVSHPITYIFSLGIFASAVAYYGVISLAKDFGYAALTYYLGTGLVFLFAPFLLRPLVALSKRFQINSMADLLTFRYGSNEVGALTTLCMVVTVIPLVVVQFKAVIDTITLLTYSPDAGGESVYSGGRARGQIIIAFFYAAAIALFSISFGSSRNHNRGLVTVMAFESVVKLVGILAVGGYCVFVVFGGFANLDLWLQENPALVDNLYEPLRDTRSHMLLMVFLSSTVALPHIFYMTVTENKAQTTLSSVTWAVPLFLLFMALPIFPIFWAGTKLGISTPTEYLPLAVPFFSDNLALTIISFIAGLSAATGAAISISLAMSTMMLNHWILPATALHTKTEIYGQLVTLRRVLTVIFVAVAFGVYTLLNEGLRLIDLALVAFIASLQMIPGILCVAHWSKANRTGLISGLVAGFGIWVFGLVIPMYTGYSELTVPGLDLSLGVGIANWSKVAVCSITLNVLIFATVSLATSQTDAERYSAELCSQNEVSHPVRLTLDIQDPREMISRLQKRIGAHTAKREVKRALDQLGMTFTDRRPYALRKLRDEIEANLSGLLGISLASEIMDTVIPFNVPSGEGVTDINLIEERLHHYRDHLSGMAAELNNLRLYHRGTLEQLPIAVCSFGQDHEILMWNRAMQSLSGIESSEVTGSNLDEIREPWRSLLVEFAQSEQTSSQKISFEINDKSFWISLYKAAIPASSSHHIQGQVILIEDITELQILEKELIHSERLASVGRLAAGVAHEIGNPVTGIDCLAQNLKYESDDKDVHETADQILSQTKRVSQIVHSLVSFSHAGQTTAGFARVSLYDCAQEGINLISLQKEKTQLRYVNNIPHSTFVHGDDQRITQVFVNLLANARDACEADTTVTIALEGLGDTVGNDPRNSTGNGAGNATDNNSDNNSDNNVNKNADNGTGNTVTVSVTDEGPGIPENIQDRILEPFFTTKDPGDGTGLGLAMVYSIIEDHNGQLDLISPADKQRQKGTKFLIKLPRSLASSDTLSNTNN